MNDSELCEKIKSIINRSAEESPYDLLYEIGQLVLDGAGVCSECHRQDHIDPLSKYCRYCGARLEEE